MVFAFNSAYDNQMQVGTDQLELYLGSYFARSAVAFPGTRFVQSIRTFCWFLELFPCIFNRVKSAGTEFSLGYEAKIYFMRLS